MNTTFDRYLIVRYLQIFAILFVSVFGLYVVIDGFSNIDEFQPQNPNDSQDQTVAPWVVLVRMGSYYSYQATWFLDLCGPILTVVDGMVVFALLLRNSELHPILAAGVPTWRLLLPVVISTAVVNGAMAANQEFVIPRIANVLQTPRDAQQRGVIEIDPIADDATGMYIGGQELSLDPQLIKNAEFVLFPRIAELETTVRAAKASYVTMRDHRRGWWLRECDKQYSQLALTAEGKSRVLQFKGKPKDLFIVSEISFDQLYNRQQSSRLLSTPELIRRLRNPAQGQGTDSGLAQHLHARLVRPLANIFAVLVSVPLILRRESHGLVTNMAIAAVVLVVLLGIFEAVAYCGRTGSLSPELSAWIPIFGSGLLFAWLTPMMQT